MKHKLIYFSIILNLIILLTGCWDVTNLEDRGFIVGTAIDLNNEQVNNEHLEFKITNQLVIPYGIGSPSQNEGGEQKPFLNITSTGESVYRVNEEVASKTSKIPFYEHLTILIISEDVAKTPKLFSRLLDTYIRNVNMRRGTKVVVSKGDPIKLLNHNTPEKMLPSFHIKELLEHSSRTAGFFSPAEVGDIEEFHLQENSYVLPFLDVNETITYTSGAVFQGAANKMVGVFNTKEMNGLDMMEGKNVGKVIDFLYKDEVFAFEVVRLKNKVSVDPTNIDNIKVKVNIDIDGVLKETFRNENFTKSDEIKSVQNAVSNEAIDFIEKAIHKGQKEFNADVFFVWRILESKHYDTWKKVKDDWEKGKKYFANVTFDVDVNTEIYSIGTTNKTD